ncbi:hypothetical protein GCM10020331_012240 [Ectobacillus funiculus]
MADIHGTLDKLESPINMLQQYIRETEEQIVKAQQALSQQLYLEKKYETLIAETEALAAKKEPAKLNWLYHETKIILHS